MRGLDFGSGPGPTLSYMFEEAGLPCAIYDPFYADIPAVLEKTYDFLSCTEAMEHFYNPYEEIKRMLNLVKPNGWIGIMTQLVENRVAFKTWNYTADSTHVCYFSQETFRWLGTKFNLHIEFPDQSVVLAQKRCTSTSFRRAT